MISNYLSAYILKKTWVNFFFFSGSGRVSEISLMYLNNYYNDKKLGKWYSEHTKKRIPDFPYELSSFFFLQMYLNFL